MNTEVNNNNASFVPGLIVSGSVVVSVAVVSIIAVIIIIGSSGAA